MEVLREAIFFAMVHLRNRSSTAVHAMRVATWAVTVHAFYHYPIHSFLSLLGTIPGFLQSSELIHVVGCVLFVFVNVLPFIRFRVNTSQFARGDVARVFLSTWGYSCN